MRWSTEFSCRTFPRKATALFSTAPTMSRSRMDSPAPSTNRAHRQSRQRKIVRLPYGCVKTLWRWRTAATLLRKTDTTGFTPVALVLSEQTVSTRLEDRAAQRLLHRQFVL